MVGWVQVDEVEEERKIKLLPRREQLGLSKLENHSWFPLSELGKGTMDVDLANHLTCREADIYCRA